ncbi:hypothetical protein IVA80_10310 [Bradyrhizobium sp. 139]|uniref:hypothetical protein n=1 Tax=Bradyrhizobium sp. 139 TaxID=2782616 RepID=UPI001FFA6A24|nr:hypothetical protein [Bradyrhizobium sp. 139]MCK1741249.1 hypothetical protein [Bradyrhizobium sp. 139]
MIDRRTLCVGATVSAFVARGDAAAAMPSGPPRQPIEAGWTYAQLVPPARQPRREDFADPKAFDQYLTENAYKRFGEASISIDSDARAEIQQAIGRSVEAAFRPQKGEIRKGETLDALPLEYRRVVVLRNFNTFVEVLIVVALKEGNRLIKETVNRVQGFLCPLYPICTG